MGEVGGWVVHSGSAVSMGEVGGWVVHSGSAVSMGEVGGWFVLVLLLAWVR
jgi:hypothetical protein